MSENPKIVYVPWYIADWLSDALSLDPHEYYLYHRILMEQYKDGAPVKRSMCERIANALRTLCGVEATTAQEKLDFVLDRFFIETEDGFSNKRAESEIAKYVSKSEKARESAKCKGKKVANAERTLTERNANAERTLSDRSANQNQNQNQNIDIRSASAPSSVADAPESEKKSKKSEAVQMPEGCDPQHWADWKKARKAPLTQTAWKRFVAEADKAGITAVEAVRICAEKGWRGFEADWLKKDSQTASNGYSTIKRTPEEEAKAVAMAKEYWERREAEAQKQASSDPFDRAMKKDSEKEAEKQIEDALGGFGMIHNVRGRR
jgi:uncharacterized protein YdaU (DUF1376 family)